jgi:hypothetical protein
MVNVIGARYGLLPRKIKATSRSFQTHMNSYLSFPWSV